MKRPTRKAGPFDDEDDEDVGQLVVVIMARRVARMAEGYASLLSEAVEPGDEEYSRLLERRIIMAHRVMAGDTDLPSEIGRLRLRWLVEALGSKITHHNYKRSVRSGIYIARLALRKGDPFTEQDVTDETLGRAIGLWFQKGRPKNAAPSPNKPIGKWEAANAVAKQFGCGEEGGDALKQRVKDENRRRK